MKRATLIAAITLVTAFSAPEASAKEQLVVAWRNLVPIELKALRAARDAFDEKYGIEVKLTTFPWGDGDDKLFTMFAAGIGPDVWSNVFRSGFIETIADIRGLSTVVSAAEVHRCPAFGHPAARATA